MLGDQETFPLRGLTKEYETLRSPGSWASLLKRGHVYNYCAMRGICLLNRAISPTFLPLYPGHSRFHQMYFPPSSPPDIVDSTRCIFLMGVQGYIQEDYRVKFRPLPCFRSSRPLPGLLSLIYSLGLTIISSWASYFQRDRLTRLNQPRGGMGDKSWVGTCDAGFYFF